MQNCIVFLLNQAFLPMLISENITLGITFFATPLRVAQLSPVGLARAQSGLGDISMADCSKQAPLKQDCLRVVPVSGWDDLMKVMAIRSAVYMGEGGRSYLHEFDGNDHHATHILALVDDEPAGCCRIRYFGDFAKPERLAVLPKFRRGRYGKRGVPYEIASYAFSFCAKKGFRTIYGHAVEHLVSFWARFGTSPMPDGSFDIEGYRCVAMSGSLSVPNDAIHIDSGHLVLVRREGHWDEPGVLEGLEHSAGA